MTLLAEAGSAEIKADDFIEREDLAKLEADVQSNSSIPAGATCRCNICRAMYRSALSPVNDSFYAATPGVQDVDGFNLCG